MCHLIYPFLLLVKMNWQIKVYKQFKKVSAITVVFAQCRCDEDVLSIFPTTAGRIQMRIESFFYCYYETYCVAVVINHVFAELQVNTNHLNTFTCKIFKIYFAILCCFEKQMIVSKLFLFQ